MSETISELLVTYPYLVVSLGLLAVALAALAVAGGGRRAMLISGLLSAPTGLASIVFVPEYWQPVRVAALLLGPEDAIFSFANGVVVWMFALWALSGRLTVVPCPRRLLSRYLTCGVIGHAVFLPLYLSAVGVMTATLVGMLALTTVMLRLRPELWPMAIGGGLGFLLHYGLVLAVSWHLLPDWFDQWSHENLWGLTVGGVPLEELAWALGYGVTWPLMVAWQLDARLTSVPRPTAR